MINFNDLSTEEILELDKKIQEYKKSKKFMTGYEVTFAIRFNPNKHKDDMLTSDGDPDPGTFADYLADTIAEQIADDFKLQMPEQVSGFTVTKLKPDQMTHWFD